MRRAAYLAVGVFLALAGLTPPGEPAEQVIFGPTTYTRTSGSPNVYVDSFALPATLIAPFRLHVQNGNPDGTHRVSSATLTLNGVQVAGPSDFNQQVAAFDKTVSLHASNTLQVRLTSAPGSFLVITVFGTVPPPTLSSLLPPALPITVGASGTLTATITPVQPTPTVIALSSDATGVATVPATTTVPANQTSVGIPVTGVAPGSATITATLNTSSVHSTVTVAPSGPTLTSLLPATLQITQGASGTLTVTINAAQATDTVVALASSDTTVAGLPPTGTVTVPAGQTSQAFAVFGVAPGPATITATLNGTSAHSLVTVVTPLPTVVSLLPPVLPLTEGSSGTLTVTLNATQPTDTDVALATSDPTIVGLPPGNKVTVPAHTLSASFPVAGLKRGMATVTASLNGTSATAAIEVQPPLPTVQALACPATLTVSATGLCTVTLNATQLTNTVVPLASSAPGTASVPPSVTVPANTLSAQFAVTAGAAPGQATITAGPLNGTSKTADVQVLPPPPTIVSLLPASATIFVGATTSLTLTLNAAQLSDTSVPLASSAPGTASVPPSVTVPAGSLTATVVITGLTPGQATITAGPLNGTQAQSTITVNQLPPTIVALTPNALTLPKGKAGTLTVTIAPTQPAPTVVPLTSNDPSVGVPLSVTVPAGASSAPFPVLANSIGSATITAGPLNATSQTATVTVTPPELVSLAVTPAAPSIAKGQTQPFTATGTFTDATTQDLTSTASWTSSDTSVATITSPGGVAAGVGQGSAQITAAVGAIVSPPATLTVTPPVLVALAVSPTNPTRDVGQTLQFQATGTLTDGTTQDLTAAVSWTSGAPAVATITSPGGLATALAPGPTTITATHAASGLTASTTLTVAARPTVAITSPANGALTNQTSLTVTGTVTVPAGLASVNVNGVVATVSAGTFSAPNVPLPAEGSNTLTATATDSLGQTATATVTVTRDTTPPALAITSPTAGAATNQTTVAVTGTVSDASGLAGVTVNGVAATLGAGTFAATVPVAEGANTLTAVATDKAGNAASSSVTVTRDTSPPTLQITAPAPQAVVFGSVAVTATAGDTGGTGIASLTVTNPAGLADTDPAPNLFAAQWDTTALPEGPFTLTARAQDAAGNVTTTSVDVVIANLGQFAPAPGLPGPRAAHSATLLNDGTVYLFGGRDDTGAVLNTALRFDPGTGLYSPVPFASAPLPRRSHAAVLLPTGQVLVAGGVDGSPTPVTLGSAELHDGAGNVTPLGAALGTPRGGHTATLLTSGQVLIVGGTDANGNVLTSAELFDPVAGLPAGSLAGAFQAHPATLGTARSGHSATLLPDGRVLVPGGRTTGGTLLTTAEVFDPATNLPAASVAGAFAALPAVQLPEGRTDHTATLLPTGDVLVAGGRTAAGTTASALLLRLTPPASRPLVPLAAPRASATATLLPNGRVLVAGGETNPVLDTAEQFVPTPPDAVAPAVAEVRPPAGATDVPTDSRVAVRFTEPLDPRTLTPNAFRLTSPDGPIAGTLATGEQGLLAFFTPAAPLSFGTTFTVNLGAALLDLAGNALPPFTSAFTVQLGGALALTLNPATVNVGQGSTLTVTLPVPAPAAGVTVTLTNGAPSVATLASSGVTIPQGQQSATVAVTTLGPGAATITGSAFGFADGAATLTVILPPPTVTSFTPTSGRVADSVAITGTNFATVSGVTFNGVTAPGFTVNSLTSLTVPVATAATTGPIAVTTSAGTGTSTGSFVVVPTQDFQLAALPSTITVPSAGQGSFNISMTGAGGFIGLTTLAVTGVPSGVTATFAAPTLTAGQQTLLTALTNGTTPQGPYTLTIAATGLMNGVQTTRSANVTLQVQPAGQTSLTGQVLDEDANPVKGAVVRLGGLQATTDDAGNFLLANPPVGPDQLMTIDGGPASSPGKSFPIIPYKVTIVGGQANTLGFTPYLHFQKTTGMVDISNSSVQRTVTDPTVPGFQMTIPAGVTVTGWDGQPNTQVSIRRFVATDRTPIPPLPDGLYSPTGYMYYFGKQGGGTPSAPVPITVPNDLDVPPGTQVELWFYDEAPDGSRPNQMAKFGTGTVSADGSQIIPDIDPTTGKQYGQPRFCCGWFRALLDAARRATINLLRGGQNLLAGWGNRLAADPVDPATGLWVVQKSDMVLPGRLPIVFTRIHRPNGASIGPFGPGTSHTYHVLLLVEQNLRTLVLPGGTRIAFPQQANGTWQNFADPSVRGAVITASGSNHVLRFKDGTTWTFGAAPFGTAFLVAQTDRNGNTLTVTRTGFLGNITAITEPSGRQLTVTNDASNRITSITDPIGRTVTYTYNASGNLATVTDPAGGVTSYTYDAQNRMTSITDPRGITYITTEYDSAGRVSRQTQADGGVWQFAYTVTAGAITQTVVTDPRGNPTTYRFNGQGYPLSQIDALGQMTTYTRDPATNLLLATTDPLGSKTQFAYDATGNVTTITDAAGNVRTFTYDPSFNRVTSFTDPLGNKSAFGYDPTNGNLLTTTDPLGAVTQISYNSFGQPTATTDALGNVTQLAYNSQGDLATISDPLGNTTTRAYDQVSRGVQQTDPRGKATAFGYDALDRLLSIVDPLGGTTAFGYDPNGNLLTVTDARGNTITHEYDSMDRLSRRIDQLGAPETFTYDGVGNLVNTSDRKGQTTTFTYNALNRRVQSAFADGAVAAFTYDAAGRLTKADDTADPHRPIAMAYDNLDQLTAETTALGTLSYAYDALGRRTSMVVGGEGPVAYSYDANSRLRTITQAPFNTVDIEYDPLNRRTHFTLPNGVTTDHQYDSGSRLTSLTYRNSLGVLGDLTYDYDPAGNRAAVGGSVARTLLPDPVAATTYDAANRQLTLGGKTMTFDKNGNLATLTEGGQTTTYSWDARDQLSNLSRPGLTASFLYDAAARRAQKMIGGRVQSFLYDGMDVIREVAGGTAANYLRGLSVDEPLVRTDATGTVQYLTDVLGSTVALADSASGIITNYSYGPFGQTASTGQPTASPFAYAGREDDGTGLYYYRTRYYVPVSCRFASEDPIGGESGDLNFYLYVSNNPLSFTDPLGLEKRDKCTFFKRFKNNWLATHTGWLPKVPKAAKLAIGLATAAEIANPMGVPTPLQFVQTYLRDPQAARILNYTAVALGAPTFARFLGVPLRIGGFMSTAQSARVVFSFAAGKAILVAGAFEVGTIIGSAVNAGIIQPVFFEPGFGCY